MLEIERKVRGFVVENFLFGEGGDDLTSDKSFLDSGIIDSTGVLELVTFVEEQYGIKVNDDELIPENLDSIARIAKFIASKQQQKKAA